MITMLMKKQPGRAGKLDGKSGVNAEEVMKNAVATATSQRELENRRLEITRYSQEWELLPTRSVKATTTMEFYVTLGTYLRSRKSLAESFHTLNSVQVFEVFNDGTNASLSYDLFEEGDFQFVSWSFSSPLSAGESSTFVVDYTITSGAVRACGDTSEVPMHPKFSQPPACAESFHAIWANYWAVPVSNITYSFTMPTRDDQFPYYDTLGNTKIPYLISPEDCISGGCDNSKIEISTLGTNKTGPSVTWRFDPNDLAIGSRYGPRDIAFGWRVAGYCTLPISNLCVMDEEDDIEWYYGLIGFLFVVVFPCACCCGLLWLCFRCYNDQSNRSNQFAHPWPSSSRQQWQGTPVQATAVASRPNDNVASRPNVASMPTAPPTESINKVASLPKDYAPTEAQTEGNTCKVCMEHAIDSVLLPCSHRAVCLSCAYYLTECPICRGKVDDRLRVYDV